MAAQVLSGYHADATFAGNGVDDVHHQKTPSRSHRGLGTDVMETRSTGMSVPRGEPAP